MDSWKPCLIGVRSEATHSLHQAGCILLLAYQGWGGGLDDRTFILLLEEHKLKALMGGLWMIGASTFLFFLRSGVLRPAGGMIPAVCFRVRLPFFSGGFVEQAKQSVPRLPFIHFLSMLALAYTHIKSYLGFIQQFK